MRWCGASSIQRGVAVAVLALAALAGFPSVPAGAQPPPPSEDDLAAARRLFTEAVADEDAKRFDTALDKFRRVQTVKDTANVRYRVATCLEALGRRAEALSNYQATLRLGEGDRTATDAVRAASEHASLLERVIPRLSIVLPPEAPAGTQVRVDDAPVDVPAQGDGVALDPGPHTITAIAPGHAPFRTGVTLPEWGRVSITVNLVPLPPAPPVSASVATSASALPPETGGGGPPAGAWVAAGLGGALAAGSIVSFVLRTQNLNTLTRICGPAVGGKVTCPPSSASEVNSAHDAAAIEGPLGIGLAVGAAVSAGVAVWLFAAPPSRGVQVTPVVSQRGGMLVVGGPLER